MKGHAAKKQLLCREACNGSGCETLGVGEWGIRGCCIHQPQGPAHKALLSAGLNLTRGSCGMSQYELRMSPYEPIFRHLRGVCHPVSGPCPHEPCAPVWTRVSLSPAAKSRALPRRPPLKIHSANSGRTRTKSVTSPRTGAWKLEAGRVLFVHRCNASYRWQHAQGKTRGIGGRRRWRGNGHRA
jgi:hypothetical protein